MTPWAHQAPPSMEFSRQEYWSGLPFPSPGDLPDSGIEPRSPALWSLYRLSHQRIPKGESRLVESDSLQPSMDYTVIGILRQEYWSHKLFPSPGDLPNPGIELMSTHTTGGFFTS